MVESDIVSEKEKIRCKECGSIMFQIKYKHNGNDKIALRCPSPHGLRSKKEFPILETISLEELEII